MVTLALPANVEIFYSDCLDAAHPPEVERAYRQSFLAGARVAAGWLEPDEQAIDDAWEARHRAKRAAAIEDGPCRDFFRPGHELEAARTRGWCQALEAARQTWDELDWQQLPLWPNILATWLSEIERWAQGQKLECPPWPLQTLSPEQSLALEKLNPMPATPLPPGLAAKSIRELMNENPELRRPVIHGLLREGETMNVIASPKIGKSWLVTDLALAVAAGRMWLDTFECERGDVLIIDNELHSETTAHRIPKVMRARGVALDEVADHVFVANVRGRLKDIFGLAEYFQTLTPGRFKLIVLDAFYRFMPKDSDENDNGTMSQVYNHIDSFAARLGCSFVLVHHSSKGNQSGKAVTDVGAGAGSQSRATDTHLILRPHMEDDVVVLDAAVRSWAPLLPRCLRWTFPVWTPDDRLDPAALRPERQRRPPKSTASPVEPIWDAERFVEAFMHVTPQPTLAIVQAAMDAGVPEGKAKKLLKQAEAKGIVHRWRFGANQPVQFATVNQPEKIS